LETLGGEVKDLLFAPEPLKASPPLLSENQAVRAILSRIIGKWRKEIEGAAVDEIVPETVFLSREKVAEMSQRVEETIPETVISTPGAATPKPSRPPGPTKMEDMEVEGKSQTPKGVEKSGETPRVEVQPEEDFLSETVILSADKLRELKKRGK
jgi:hypothetical protein